MHEETDHILFKNIARIYYVADGDTDPLVERVMRYFIKKKKIQENFKKAFWEADKYILPLKTFSDVLLTEFLMFKALFTSCLL